MPDIPWGPYAIGYLDRPTSDGRVVESAGYSCRTLPLPMDWQEYTTEGHDQAVTVGRVDMISVDPFSGQVMAAGVWLDEEIIPAVVRARYLAENRIVYPSMEPGRCAVEIRPTGGGEPYYNADGMQVPAPSDVMSVFTEFDFAKVTLVAVQAFEDLWMAPPPGTEPMALVASVRSEGWSDMPVAPSGTVWDGDAAANRVFDWATDSEGNTDWSRYARAFLYRDDDADPETKGAYGFGVADMIDGELTIVPRAVAAVAGALAGARGGTTIPEADQDRMRAVVESLRARIEDQLGNDVDDEEMAALTAAADGRPPREYFANPGLTRETPVTVSQPDAQGWRRVFGHIGVHGRAHRGLPGNVMIPKSMSGYREFLLGETFTSDGSSVFTGKITIGGGHADGSLGMRPAAAHYDDVSTTIANVTAGDDEIGVWISGAIVASATDEQIDELLQSPPSGDWRTDVLGNLELITIHSVNTPGFAVYRVGMDDKGGYSLVASSALVGRSNPDDVFPDGPGGYVQRLAAELAPLLRESLTADAQPEVLPEVTEYAAFSFDPDGDLAAQFADAGIPWPTISLNVGGVEYAPYPVAESCVRGMLAAARPVEVVTAAAGDDAALRRAMAKMRLAGMGD